MIKISKSVLNLLGLLTFTIVILPIIILAIKFGNQNISDNISDWSDFGGYISGTTNTLVSILSLIILGYLTYFIGKQSSQENKKVNLLLRKLDAYDALVAHMPRLNMFIYDFSIQLTNLHQELKTGLMTVELQNKKDKLANEIRYMNELNSFLYSFNNRYGHLFEYDFGSDNHKKLIETGNKIQEAYQKLSMNLQTKGSLSNILNMESHEKLSAGIEILMKGLREEIEKNMEQVN